MVRMVARAFTGEFLLILVGVLFLLTLVGLLMWRLEKREVQPLPKERAALSKALFCAFEPVIGYKASQHTTRAGRVLGTVWGLFGVVLVSGLTANLAAQLTLRNQQTGVRSVADLPRYKIGMVEHTSTGRFFDRRGIQRHEFPSLEAALTALEAGTLDAVVDDEINLRYALKTTHDRLALLPGTFWPHSSAFGLKPDSPLRKDLNAAIVKTLNTDTWAALMASYLGKVD
ncbi:MAG TPA: transporter substrate-binding domain-containing protein, partial [Kofleriaceae bacterium]